MTAGQRESEETGRIREQLVQKLESWLRAHFDEESAKRCSDGAMERMLMETASDWCYNRGVSVDTSIIWDACEDAIKRYRSNWEGKVQGEDDRSHNLGRALKGSMRHYSV